MEYPERIYVEQDSEFSTENLCATGKKEDLAPDIDKTKKVAVYKLEKIVELTTRVLDREE